MAGLFRVMRCILNQPNFMAPAVDMSGKTVVITGPTKGGIGYETARGLAKFGANLILAARNPTTAAEAVSSIRAEFPAIQVEHASADVSDLRSVSSFAENAKQLAPSGVDVLVCNAGAQFSGVTKTAEGVEMTFAVCVLGHHKLIHLLRPRRVVWVTGDVYVLSNGAPDPFDESAGFLAYPRACLARLLLAREWKRLQDGTDEPMEVVCVHPGVTASDFAKLGGLGKWFAGSVLISPELGAQASVLTASASSADIHQDQPLSYYHNKWGWMEFNRDDLALDEQAGMRLMEQCDQLCNIGRQ